MKFPFLFLLMLLFSPAIECAPQSPSQSTATQIVLLGTGTPNADPDRFGPSIAIVVNDMPYIVDFGPGVVRRASAAVRKGVTGLAMPKLKCAFVTHLHSDHTVGYADLIFTPWVLERTEPLEVYPFVKEAPFLQVGDEFHEVEA